MGAVFVADEETVLNFDDSNHVAVVEFLLRVALHLAKVGLGIAGGLALVVRVQTLTLVSELLLWGRVVLLLLLGRKGVVLCWPGDLAIVVGGSAVADLVLVTLHAHLLLVVLVETLGLVLGKVRAVCGGWAAQGLLSGSLWR